MTFLGQETKEKTYNKKKQRYDLFLKEKENMSN